MRIAPIAGVLVAVLIGLLTWSERTALPDDTWSRADYTLLDAWTRLAPERPVPDDIVVVLIDDKSFAKAPELIERRYGMARLVDALRAAGPRVIAIDLFFADSEQILPPDLAVELGEWMAAPDPDTPDRAAALIERAHAETTGDAQLEAAMDDGPIVLAAHFGQRGGGTLETTDRSLTRGTYAQVVPGEALPGEAPQILASLPQLNKAVERVGVITFFEDGRGARRMALATRSEARHFVPFSFQALAAYEGVKRSKMAFLGNEGTVVLGDRRITGDPHAMWLNWRNADAYTDVSALDVVNGDVDPKVLKDKLVLLGVSYFAHDTVGTPWGPKPGVFMHAVAIDNVLNDNALVRAPAWVDALLTTVLGGSVALVFAVGRLRTTGRLVAIAVGAGIAVALPAWLRIDQNVWIGSIGPMLAVGFSATTAVSMAWLQEGAQARELRRMFASYVSDDLVDAMVANPELVTLRGERRELSVLFSDIRDFTSFSEQIAPLELVAFLNAYLTPMTRAVLDNRGFVDKFIGDAVMALWGAPVPDDDHAANACRTALDMYVALDAVRPEAEKYGIDLAIGVGVNTGEVAVGNMGSAERFEYTVLGDAVNLASRLEGLTKRYGAFCLVGPATAAALPDTFQLRRLDLVRVKGKAEPVEIFELCADERITVTQYAALDAWNRMLDAFRAGRFAEAREALTVFRAANPQDAVATVYDERLTEIGDIVPADWDGVFTHTRK